jgi:peptidyl-prolyl cis-trans isomerase A (cyclophilin A)
MSRQPGTYAVLKTSEGTIVCKLFEKEAPKTVANFIELAEGKREWTHPVSRAKSTDKLYDGTVFHRVIPDFMIQGGDPTATGMGDPGYFFNDEIVADLNFDVAGRLAMANAGPNTNGSQFFITVTPQPSLDQHYTIFGQCDPNSALVADSIAQVPRGRQDKPIEPVYLNKVTIVQPGQPMPPPPAPAAPQAGSAATPSASAQP